MMVRSSLVSWSGPVLMVATGTPATTSQMAKDVVTFLNWAAEPEHDERKKMGIKAVILFSALFAVSIGVKRFKWTVIKNRKICESSTSLTLLADVDSALAVYNPPKDLNH
jgi:ubiquinol-cytochrome c reductase cytochrome c1 subunit